VRGERLVHDPVIQAGLAAAAALNQGEMSAGFGEQVAAVEAAVLVHGVQIHDRLTHARQPREIVPLATLTHELNGGSDWPAVGDWEAVTTDLVRVVRERECDALRIGMSAIARALICTGPHGQVRAFDASAEASITYGPAARGAILAKVDRFLTCLVAVHDLWPGDGLLPPRYCASDGRGGL
jgi:hypothetical protein